MTPEDEIMLSEVLRIMKEKYQKGNEEHAGTESDIQNMKLSDLFKNSMMESMDSVFYNYRGWIKSKGMGL